MAKTARSKKLKSSRRTLFLLFLLAAALVGYRAAFNLPDEKRHRINKLLYEAREMPFRIFV